MPLLKEKIVLTGLCRTPIGKLGGILAPMEPYNLLGTTLRAALERSGLPPEEVASLDDVIAGNVRNSIGNIARVGALDAGVPDCVPAQTVDRQCASSMEALAIAAAKINGGIASQILVGGVESASRCPWMYEKSARPYAYFEPQPYTIRLSTPEAGDPPMGETAEILADEFHVPREQMDEFAAQSHALAHAATEEGRFEEEIVPLPNPNRKGHPDILRRDECIRADSTPEVLAKLRPVFRRDGGRVTAGNSSPLNDAAAACMAFAETAAARHGIVAEARLAAITTVALDPKRMGLGPALAIPRLLAEANLGVDDVDLYEINEAFAAQVLAVLRHLADGGCAIPPEKLNVNGGAIALGHPLGATGLRLIVTLVNALRQRGLKRGVASLCVGGGQGMAVLVEVQ